MVTQAQPQPSQQTPPKEKMSYEEFLAWCDEDTRAEWVDGDVIMMTPASRRHQAISKFLLILMTTYAENKSSGEVLNAPFQMKTGMDLAGREPDILFVAEEHRERLKDTYLDGPADLVVEIVSPESRLRDRGAKFAEYEMGGVREYWIIDPELTQVDFYVLDEEGRYRRRQPDSEGVYHSQVLSGFRLTVDWLWQEPLPPIVETLKHLELV